MSKKRRVFDIDLPDDVEVDTFPAGKAATPSEPKRRGPMAAAITENAGSLREREEVAAKIRAENDALAHEHVRLKGLGLVAEMIPLDKIETYKLTRDRVKGDDFELAELVASIKEIGLSNPIRVEAREDGRYELVQGFRRLSAYKHLLAETGDSEAWGAIPAGVAATGEALETLYRQMVDENLVRKDISFAEMAQLAIHYAADPATAENDPDKAVATLFQSAGYQKRSYIRTFIRVMSLLGDDLKFAQHMPRSLGLALAAQLDADPSIAGAIRAELGPLDSRTVREELDLLRRYAGVMDAKEAATPAPKGQGGRTSLPKAKTTFQIARAQGKAKCTAGAGRLEIRLDRDFSTIDRRKLESAVRSLLDEIE
ncbi:ParB/RepB/Spo0J family partition protein [Celeribacter sp.]|uniref:ParB/RepB/Spo0J family partition protein n=1 Tax=Celeribacter sp. TaxID=1890673 RepID=UPI003A8FA342